jgi:predicted PurR-regulated permease PerM
VAADPRPPLLRLTTSSVVRAVLVVAVALAAAAAFRAATRPLSWMLAALLLAGLLRPAVLWLSERIPRGFAILIVAVGSVALVGFIGYRGWSDVHRQVEFVEREAPRAARDLEDSDRYGELASEIELSDKVDTFLDDLPGTLQGGTGTDALKSTATRGPVFFATFILMVFFLVSGDRTVRGGIEQIRDPERRSVVERVVRGGYRRWCRYLALVLARAAVVGLLTWGTCRLLGIPAATVLGIWVAVWSLVPSVGIVVGSLAVALLAIPESFTTPFVLLGFAVALQVLDATTVQRQIDKRSLHVGPFLTLLAAVLGLELYGVGGLVGAVAITVLVVAFLDELAPSDESEVTEELLQLMPDDEAPPVTEAELLEEAAAAGEDVSDVSPTVGET